MRAVVLGCVVVGVLAFPAGAGSQERACTLIGCTSGLGVSLQDAEGRSFAPAGARITLCLDDLCRRYRASGSFVRLERPDQASAGPVRVRIVVRDRRSRVLRRMDRRMLLTRQQPNGPECEPVCWSAVFQLGEGLRLTRTV